MTIFPRKKIRSLIDHTGRVNCARFTKTGEYCMTCGQDRTIKLWNPHRDSTNGNGFLITTYKGPHGHEIYEISISFDQNFFASCGQEKEIFVWDVSTARIINRYYGHDQRVNSIDMNSESTILVSGSYDNTIKIWDLKARGNKPIQEMRDSKDSISCIKITDELIIASSIDDSVRIYDIRKGQLRTDKLHYPVTSVSCTYDGKSYIASTLNNSIRLIDIDDAILLNEYKGHVNCQYKLDSCLSNNDDAIITGSEDGKIYFYDFLENKIIQILDGHKNVVSCVDYHPDQHMMLSSSYDSTVGVWVSMSN